jgi:hypothetical protein
MSWLIEGISTKNTKTNNGLKNPKNKRVVGTSYLRRDTGRHTLSRCNYAKNYTGKE